MKVGTVSSSESSNCVVCKRKTSSYKRYEANGITITVPLCDHPARNCWEIIDLKDTANSVITLMKQSIIMQKKFSSRKRI